MDGGSLRSAYLPERGCSDSASSSKLLSESPSTEKSALCNSGSIISVDEVIACPSSLQPVRVNAEDKRTRRRAHAAAVAVPDVRYGCFSSLYFNLMSCWSDWTHDVDQGLSNRFFFQDTRPVRVLFVIISVSGLLQAFATTLESSCCRPASCWSTATLACHLVKCIQQRRLSHQM